MAKPPKKPTDLSRVPTRKLAADLKRELVKKLNKLHPGWRSGKPKKK
jgi:hypothetical protein